VRVLVRVAGTSVSVVVSAPLVADWNRPQLPIFMPTKRPTIAMMIVMQPPFLPVDILDPELDEKPPPLRRSSTLLLSLRPSNFIFLRFLSVCNCVFIDAANV
jgi:hypothetical protein